MILTNRIIKTIVVSLLAFLSFIHIQKIIFVGISLNQVTLIACVCLGIAILKEHKLLYSVSFYLFTIAYFVTTSDISLTPVVGFFIALHYYSDFKMIVTIIVSIPSFLVLNFFIYERSDFYNMAVLIVINLGILAFLYYSLIRKPKKRIDLWKEISDKDKSILKLYIQGKDYAQISHTLKIHDKKESIRTSITRCRNLSGCDNDIQFGIWLSEMG